MKGQNTLVESGYPCAGRELPRPVEVNWRDEKQDHTMEILRFNIYRHMSTETYARLNNFKRKTKTAIGRVRQEVKTRAQSFMN